MMILRTTAALLLLTTAPLAAEAPKVVTDILPIQSLVAQVLGETPDLVIPPSASPHNHAMRPSEAAALEAADLVIWMGPELAPWLGEAVETLAPDAVSFPLLAAEGTHLRSYEEAAHDEEEAGHDDHDDHHGDEDHAAEAHDDDHDHDKEETAEAHDDDHHHDHGAEEAAKEDHGHDDHGHDDHGAEEVAADDHDHGHHHHDGEDPHAWLDPDNAVLWLGLIADALAAQDPDNAATYRANAEAGQAAIAAARDEAASILAPVSEQAFLTFHDAFGYFEESFALNSVGSIRDGEAVTPGAATLERLRLQVEEQKIACIFTEPQYDPAQAQTLSDGTAAQVAQIDPLGAALDPGAGLYPALLTSLARDLAECLTPQG